MPRPDGRARRRKRAERRWLGLVIGAAGCGVGGGGAFSFTDASVARVGSALPASSSCGDELGWLSSHATRPRGEGVGLFGWLLLSPPCRDAGVPKLSRSNSSDMCARIAPVSRVVAVVSRDLLTRPLRPARRQAEQPTMSAPPKQGPFILVATCVVNVRC